MGVPVLKMTTSPFEYRHAHTRNGHAVGDAEIVPIRTCRGRSASSGRPSRIRGTPCAAVSVFVGFMRQQRRPPSQRSDDDRSNQAEPRQPKTNRLFFGEDVAWEHRRQGTSVTNPVAHLVLTRAREFEQLGWFRENIS